MKHANRIWAALGAALAAGAAFATEVAFVGGGTVANDEKSKGLAVIQKLGLFVIIK